MLCLVLLELYCSETVELKMHLRKSVLLVFFARLTSKNFWSCFQSYFIISNLVTRLSNRHVHVLLDENSSHKFVLDAILQKRSYVNYRLYDNIAIFLMMMS